MRQLLGSIVLVGLAVSACGDDGDDSAADDDAPGLVGRTFLSDSVTVDGEPFELVAGTRIRLVFRPGELGADAGCNSLFGSFTLDDDRVVVGQMGGTEMGCAPELMAQDQWLTGVLQTGPTFRLDGDRLRLEAEGTVLEFVDREVADPDRPLEGTTWQLDGIISGDAVSSAPSPATVRFADGQVVVEIEQCNGGSGPATVDDDAGTIDIEPLIRTLIACPELPAQTESAVYAVLDGTIGFEVDARSLTLRHPSGSGLLFRVA